MDMSEQEIIRQSLGDTIEGVDNEVEVIQSADCGLASKTDAVNLKGDPSCERPAANVTPGEFFEENATPDLGRQPTETAGSSSSLCSSSRVLSSEELSLQSPRNARIHNY